MSIKYVLFFAMCMTIGYFCRLSCISRLLLMMRLMSHLLSFGYCTTFGYCLLSSQAHVAMPTVADAGKFNQLCNTTVWLQAVILQ